MLGSRLQQPHGLQHGSGCSFNQRTFPKRCSRTGQAFRVVSADGNADVGGVEDLAPKPTLRAPPPRPIPRPMSRPVPAAATENARPGRNVAVTDRRGPEQRFRNDRQQGSYNRNGRSDRPEPANENGNGRVEYNGNGRGPPPGVPPRPPAAAAPVVSEPVVFTFEDEPEAKPENTPAPADLEVKTDAAPPAEAEAKTEAAAPAEAVVEDSAPSEPSIARDDSTSLTTPAAGFEAAAGPQLAPTQPLPEAEPGMLKPMQPRPPRPTMVAAPPPLPAAQAPAEAAVPELAGPPKMAPPPVRPIPRPRVEPGPRPRLDRDRAPGSDVSTWKERQGNDAAPRPQQGRDDGPSRQQQGQGQWRGGPGQGQQQQQWRGGPPPPSQGAGPGQQRPGFQRQVIMVRDNTPDGGRGGGRMGQRGKGRGQQTSDMLGARRTNRAQRKAARYETRLANQDVREEIFEVGVEGMQVADLAQKLAISPGEVVKALFMKGIMVQVNQVLDPEIIRMVAADYEVEVLDREEEGLDTMARKSRDFVDEGDLDFLQTRPPVVTVMGHVDHGKTSLLDFVRKSKVAAGEAGGITQAIGAYTCEVPAGEGTSRITFLDTPGHEAFSAMRARGTRVTDIAIIVVAADDGVRPQTLEAIGHARAAEVPIIVAINKMDKEGANPDRVKQELSEAGLLPEEWGGTAPMVPISAKTGDGVDTLLETVALVAEMEQFMANPDKPAVGTVIEANLDRRTGPVATLLVAAGTLRPGDVVVAGAVFGKVRSLTDNIGEVAEAGPSIAVQMAGLNAVPTAGDDFRVCETEQEARRQAEDEEERLRLQRLAEQAGTTMVTTASFASMDEADDTPMDALQRLNIILKTDASGSLGAVRSAVGVLPQDKVMLRFLLAAPNEITASDVDLAYASGGIIVGFNVEPDESVRAAAKQKGVEIVTYRVIYDLVDEMRARMEGRLATVEERTAVGEAQVRAVFGSGSRRVAGCLVTEGFLRKDCHVEVLRGRKKEVVHAGKLSSLRRVKDVVKEVAAGTECGAAIDNFVEWQEGDIISCFDVRSKARTLEEASESGKPQLAAAPA